MVIPIIVAVLVISIMLCAWKWGEVIPAIPPPDDNQALAFSWESLGKAGFSGVFTWESDLLRIQKSPSELRFFRRLSRSLAAFFIVLMILMWFDSTMNQSSKVYQSLVLLFLATAITVLYQYCVATEKEKYFDFEEFQYVFENNRLNLEEVTGLQILQHRVDTGTSADYGGSYRLYDINLLLDEDTRIHVTASKDKAHIEKYAEEIAKILNIKIWKNTNSRGLRKPVQTPNATA